MAQDVNANHGQCKQGSISLNGRALDLLDRLISGFKAERAAIESDDLDELQRIGEELELLLGELKKHFPSQKSVSEKHFRQLQELLRTARQERSKNRLLLEKQKEDKGKAITAMAAGKRTLKAYHPFGAERGELFLKKKC